MAIAEEKDKDAKSPKTIVRLNMGTAYTLEPLKIGQEIDELLQPAGSGGLMAALYQLRRFLVLGQKGFEGDFHHGGHEPLYPPPADGSTPRNIKDLRIDAEVIRTEHSAVVAKWYFSLKDQTLLAFEVQVDKEKDPCEVYLSDYRMSEGRLLPHRWEVRYGDDRFAVLNIKNYQLAAAK